MNPSNQPANQQPQPAAPAMQPPAQQPQTAAQAPNRVPTNTFQGAAVAQNNQDNPAATKAASSSSAPKKSVANNPNSTQNNLEIAEIRDGIVIMNDGSFRGVIMAKSINFDLMSQQEREGVELGYQNFLNSLDFPIQIYIRSRKIDLAPYINKLDKIRNEHDNMLLSMLMADYVDYIERLSHQVNVMDKSFYVVVPFFPGMTSKMQNQKFSSDKNFVTGILGMFNRKQPHVTIDEAKLESAKTELRNRVQSVLGGLMECSVQGLPLDTQELIELYYDTYNPDTSTRQQLSEFNSMTADIITKGEGNAPQAHLQGEVS